MPTFTARLIASEPVPASGQRFVFDQHRDAPRGFGLRITAAGGRAFVLRYRTTGKVRLLTVGDATLWPLSDARAEARRLALEIDQGGDPLGDRNAEKAAEVAPTALTVSGLVKAYAPTTHAQAARYLTSDWEPAHGGRLLTELRRRDIIELVETKAMTAPVAAGALLTFIRGALDWAQDREHVEVNVARSIRPGKLHRVAQPAKRARVLTDAEICRLWAAPATPANNVLRLILLTGQRPGEARGPVGKEVIGDVWTIPAERRKTRVEHAVPLPPLALAMVAIHAPMGEALLASAAASLNDPELWPSRASVPWRPHDLRRTCRTRLAEVGVSEVVAERVIGHAVQGIVAVYDRHSYIPEMRDALQHWHKRLLEIVSLGPRGADDV